MTPDQIASAFSALRGEVVCEVNRLPGGSRLPSWRVTTCTVVYAVRLYADERPAYDQARLLTYLAHQGFPVPEVVSVGTYGSHHVLALEWVRGVTVAEALRAHPEHAQRLGRTVDEVHARLHAVAITPEMRASLEVLQAPGPPGGRLVLIHLDFHLLNVMTDGSFVTGVIDWENVRLGDARFDVARVCADPSIRALPGALQRVVRTFRRGYLEGYHERSQREPLTALAPFLAWAGRFMLDDLGERPSPSEAGKVERWSRWWRYHSR